jgi:hypothetical protein
VLIDVLLEIVGDYGLRAAADLVLAKHGESHPTELADQVTAPQAAHRRVSCSWATLASGRRPARRARRGQYERALRTIAHGSSEGVKLRILAQKAEAADTTLARSVLTALGLAVEPASFAPARDPPQAEFAWDDPA